MKPKAARNSSAGLQRGRQKVRQSKIEVTRHPIRIEPDPTRVIPRFFSPGDDKRARRTIERVLTLTEVQVSAIVLDLEKQFRTQHPDIADVWVEHYDHIRHTVPLNVEITTKQRLLIGAFFTMEYAIESAALFNPSMVQALDQGDLPAGSTRFLMSLRATGEGHVSSIVFRRGVIDTDNHIIVEMNSPVSRPLKKVNDFEYVTETFTKTLTDIGAINDVSRKVLAKLGDRFTYDELSSEIENENASCPAATDTAECAENMLYLARSNYKLLLPDDVYASEIVIFPSSENESRGIEDVRLVRFTEDDGSECLYGTYTAFNGYATFPTLLALSASQDKIDIRTMYGRYAKNKGMALFPKRIRGKYVMSGRLDGENLFILESDNVRVWDEGRLVQTPKYWWEMVIIGNCGSPIETDEGWLLLTHGVGPMRQYCIGAALLDRDDPSRLIGQTREPLIVPTGEERVGYVPNVAYTCGAMLHNDTLIIPYAMSDMVTTIALVSLPELLENLKRG